MAQRKLAHYRPKKANDPKNPFASASHGDNDVSAVEQSTAPSDKLASKRERNSFVFEEGELSVTLEQQALKAKAMSFLRGNQTKLKEPLDPENGILPDDDKKTGLNSGEFVMPDPLSKEKLRDRREQYSSKRAQEKEAELRLRIRNMTDIIRTPLAKEQIAQLKAAFPVNLIKITKTEVILKSAKYGFEIYYNNADSRWWVSTLQFEEPFHPKQLKYVTYWVGTSFIGYGFPTIEEVIAKAQTMMTGGRTGFIAWRDHVVSWNESTNRILAGSEPICFPHKEYLKFVNWFTKNKIWIMVKRENAKDAEDLMLEVREQRKRGEQVNPLVGIQAKLLEPPRKPNYITAYPVPNPHYRGSEPEKVENKLYQIGFTFHE